MANTPSASACRASAHQTASPSSSAFWMDGKLMHSMPVETKPSKLVYFDPYSEEQMRLVLPEGDHVFRAAFVDDDDFVKGLSAKDAYDRKKNKFIDSITFVGPYAPKTPPPEPRQDLHLRSEFRRRLRREDRFQPGAPRLAPPGHQGGNRIAAEVRRHGEGQRAIHRSREFNWRSRPMLVSAALPLPHRARPEAARRRCRTSHQPISNWHRASAISLWSSMPDDELLALAEAGKLRTPATLDAQVKRMLADPRSSALADNFAGQWLELRNLDVVKPDPQKFPDWSPELRDAMKQETRLFFDSILRENRPLSEFLDARYTFLNERLAQALRHRGREGSGVPSRRTYHPAARRHPEPRQRAHRFQLPHAHQRWSSADKYILNNILASPPPPPPVDVPPLDEAAVGATASLRQQMEQHRANATCASCHNKMDPLGFGLENYDGIGKWRTMDGKFPVDSSGTLPNGNSFSTPGEMRTVLKSATAPVLPLHRTEKMLTYSLGRGLGSYDRRTVDEIDRKLAANGYAVPVVDLRSCAQLAVSIAKRGNETAKMITRKSLPRRAFLRGMGTAVALFRSWMPWCRPSPRRPPPRRPCAWRSSTCPTASMMNDWNPELRGPARLSCRASSSRSSRSRTTSCCSAT